MRTVSQFVLTFLLNASWQILLIAAAASLCDRILSGAAARYRHALWVVALFLTLFLPAFSSAPNSSTPPQVSVAAAPQTETVPVVVTRISSLEGEEIESAEPRTPASPVVVPATTRSWGAPIRLKATPAGVLVAIYALVVLYALLRLGRAWRQTRKIVRTAFEVELPESVQRIIETCGRVIATRRVRVLCSNSIAVPITLGVLRPIIILPQSLLKEVDQDLLTSAVGHELVHIARRDYLMNLIYEFVYLPVWCHPAAWLIRRRIRQTRELCCDEGVTSKLLRPDVYARSLVRMVGTSPLTTRLAADTTIGIVESDNLEGRIMSLLKSRKLTGRRKNVLLLIASLVLAAPCIAATPFALSFEINRQEPAVAVQRSAQDEQEKHAKLRAEMLEQVEKLKEEERGATGSARSELELRLQEVQKSLEEHERLVQQNQGLDPKLRAEADARLKEVQQNLDEHRRLLEIYQQRQGSENEKAGEAYKRLTELLGKYKESTPGEAQQYAEAQKQLEQLYRQTRKPRVIYRVEPVYPADAREKNIKGSVVLTIVVDREGKPQDIKIWKSLYPSMDQAAIEAARQMRFEPGLKDGQPVAETLLVEFYFSTQSKHGEVMGYGEGKGPGFATGFASGQGDGNVVGYASGQGTGGGVGYASGQGGGEGYAGDVREVRRRKEQEGQDDRLRKHAELTQGAVITMDRAIQVATSKYPGKVLACSLGRDKDGPVFYHLVIVNTEGSKTTTRYVWVSAVDGTILKTEEQAAAAINGGVLNGKAISLPNPEYPAIAREARAAGTVRVNIMTDELGNVISANALSGHPLLQSAAVSAARRARFSPTYLEGQAVKVRGIVEYNFVID